MLDSLPLIAGRGCGDCTVCCVELNIDQPDIQKHAGAICRHCTGSGCGVYETRPEICRAFFCLWRKLPLLEESWRPDRSGIFVQAETAGEVEGLSLMLVHNPLQTVRLPWFVDFVARNAVGKRPLMLALPGPRGHLATKTVLNSPEMMRAAATSRAEVRRLLEQALKRLSAYACKPRPLHHAGHDVSGATSEFEALRAPGGGAA